MQKRLRYADLESLGIVKSRAILGVWIKKRGFPRGQLTRPNSRTLAADEIQAWLDSRPTAPKATPATRRGRRRKSTDHAGAEA
jgi:hypothetical protein